MSNRARSVEVQIRNIAFGGEGVGEVLEENGEDNSDLKGITAFVPYTAIGDRVEAQIEELKKNHIRCLPPTILEQSEHRVEPPCEYFGTCGGCHFQHMSVDAQKEAKRVMLVGALRAARCSHTVIQAVRPLVSIEPFGYRRRVRLHVNSRGEVGFYRPRSRIIVAVKDCVIADPQIRRVIQQIDQVAQHLAGVIGSIILEADNDGVLAVLVAPFSLKEGDARRLLQEVKPVLPNCSLQVAGKEIAVSGRQLLSLPLPDGSLRVGAGGFSQSNWEINRRLIEDCCEVLLAEDEDTVFDLYAGAGNFSIPLAARGKQVVAVEGDERSVKWGMQSSSSQGLASAIRFVHSSVERYCKKSPLPKGAVVLADPPRSGLGSLIPLLQSAQTLCFVSCHLPSFVRDLKQLVELGWDIDLIQPYDMFPQTTHMEILGVFRKPQRVTS